MPIGRRPEAARTGYRWGYIIGTVRRDAKVPIIVVDTRLDAKAAAEV